MNILEIASILLSLYGAEIALEMKKIKDIITNISKKYNIDEKVIDAIIKVESNYNPLCIGKAGEIGLMQIKPSTARDMGFSPFLLFLPSKNIECGAKYLDWIRRYFTGNDLSAMVQSYNVGVGAYKQGKRNLAYLRRFYDYYYG